MGLFNNCKSMIAKFSSKTQSKKNIIATDEDSKIKDAISMIEQLKKYDLNFVPDLERSSKLLNDALDILKTNDDKNKEEMFERFYENYLTSQSNKKQNDKLLNNRYKDILMNTNINQLPN